jgi:hypothetical protein
MHIGCQWMRIEEAVAYFQTSFICTISHYEICRVEERQ